MITSIRSLHFCSRICRYQVGNIILTRLCAWEQENFNNTRSRMVASNSTLATSSMRQDAHDWNENHDFFQYTAGRFLFAEADQIARRCVKFDMNELANISARSVDSKSCVAVHKLPEGQYSKAFLMIMDDGKRAIAKVPNPNAGQPHYTTASEVATMDFVSMLSSYKVQIHT